MAHFYGFSDIEMMSMETDVFQDYWLAIDVIEATNQLNAISSSSYSAMSKENRSKYYKDLNKKAKSVIEEENKAQLSTEEAAKKLALSMGSMRG